MTQIPLLTSEQFLAIDFTTTRLELDTVKPTMDVVGELTQMLWVQVGGCTAHIPATIFRAFTLKCQQLVLVPELPLICVHEKAILQLIKRYFDICIKYAWAQEKLKPLWQILLTEPQVD